MVCTVALARRFAPLQRRRGLSALAAALGVEVDTVHRALPDARTCARVFCALFGRLCANAPTIGDALQLLSARKARRPRPPAAARRPRGERPHLAALPHEPGVYVFRDADGRVLYVGKSIDLRTRARAHFTSGASWTAQAEHVDHQQTESELGALLLEDRLIKSLRPPGNVRGKAEPDGFVYLRCRLDIAFPILEVAREPAPGHAVCVGPLQGRGAAVELMEQLNSLFGLRHCGRALPRREHPSAYGQMGRCLSPCLHDLDPNVYRERLDAALGLFRDDGGSALLARVDEQIAEASSAQRYERAAWLQRRRNRLEGLLGPPRRRPARHPPRLPPRARSAPGGGGPLRRRLDRRRPRRRLGPRGLPRRARRPFRARAGPRAERRHWAAGCPPTRSPRRAWSACGSPPTSRRRWSCAAAWASASTPRSLPSREGIGERLAGWGGGRPRVAALGWHVAALLAASVELWPVSAHNSTLAPESGTPPLFPSPHPASCSPISSGGPVKMVR